MQYNDHSSRVRLCRSDLPTVYPPDRDVFGNLEPARVGWPSFTPCSVGDAETFRANLDAAIARAKELDEAGVPSEATQPRRTDQSTREKLGLALPTYR